VGGKPQLLRLDFCAFSAMMETRPHRNSVITNIAYVVFPEDRLFLLDYLVRVKKCHIEKIKIAFRVLDCLC